jgi:hypothetical protein
LQHLLPPRLPRWTLRSAGTDPQQAAPGLTLTEAHGLFGGALRTFRSTSHSIRAKPIPRRKASSATGASAWRSSSLDTDPPSRHRRLSGRRCPRQRRRRPTLQARQSQRPGLQYGSRPATLRGLSHGHTLRETGGNLGGPLRPPTQPAPPPQPTRSIRAPILPEQPQERLLNFPQGRPVRASARTVRVTFRNGFATRTSAQRDCRTIERPNRRIPRRLRRAIESSQSLGSENCHFQSNQQSTQRGPRDCELLYTTRQLLMFPRDYRRNSPPAYALIKPEPIKCAPSQ